MTEGIAMNKYHFDDIYKISPGTKDAWKIQRLNDEEPSGTSTLYLPKSECWMEEYWNGKIILNIPIWLIGKHHKFFNR